MGLEEDDGNLQNYKILEALSVGISATVYVVKRVSDNMIFVMKKNNLSVPQSTIDREVSILMKIKECGIKNVGSFFFIFCGV